MQSHRLIDTNILVRTFLDAPEDSRRKQAEATIETGGHVLTDVVGEVCYSVRTRLHKRALQLGASSTSLGAEWRKEVYSLVKGQMSSWCDKGLLTFEASEEVFFALSILAATGIDWVDALLIAQGCINDYTICTFDGELRALFEKYRAKKSSQVAKSDGKGLKKLNLQ